MCDKKYKKAIENHLKDLNEFQNELFDKGHTFWFCDTKDETHNKPFYYYQINRTEAMATCSTCSSLMENRRKIRKLEKKLGLELTPFITNFTNEKHVKRMSVKNNSDFNPNYNYL